VAGIISAAYIYEISPQETERVIDINLKGTILGCQAVAPQMVRQGNGHIINISSMAGLAPVPGISIYVASKFGVRGFSLAIELELAQKGVKVSVVCPDATNTHMLDEQIDRPEAALTFSGNKVLTADEVANAILHDVIESGKKELWLPKSRGITAMASSIFPGVAKKIYPLLLKKGLLNQSKFRS
jgi:3-oxoacyl-[acyl-carrier protein] reductase